MAQTKFLVVLMLGIVIQLSFPAAPVHNTASSAEHVINVTADVANERKSNIHCDDDEQPASKTCCYCLTDSADTCLMDAGATLQAHLSINSVQFANKVNWLLAASSFI